MAIPTFSLIAALRTTAKQLEQGEHYQWSHMGSCNCGHLAQHLTSLTKEQIHAYALERAGDWAEQVLEFCPSSGYPMDHIIQTMLDVGMTRKDVSHLERLSDPLVLRRIPLERRNLMKHNKREDVILYMETWADMLEELHREMTSQQANSYHEPSGAESFS